MYGTGISKIGEIVDLGVKFDVINKSGAWFSYGETRLGQGRDNVKLLLEREKDLCEEIEGKIRLKLTEEKNKQKNEEKSAPKADKEAVFAPIKSRGSVRPKIDIVVDDED